jgi:C4-dicarboxylate-specific signal transduction histidine kinase
MTDSSLAIAITLIGLLYMPMPLMAWSVLAASRTLSVRHWCVGGALFGIGVLLVGLRIYLPEWLSFTVANACVMWGNLLRIQALKLELKRPWPTYRWVLWLAVYMVIYEWFRLEMESPFFRFGWGFGVLALCFAELARLSWQLAQAESSRSARWFSLVHMAAVAVVAVRVVLTGLGVSHPSPVAADIDAMVTTVMVLLTTVLGNFAFVGIFAERSTAKEVVLAKEQAQQLEHSRWRGRIAQLDRQRSLGAMSASISHELNQPLAAILLDANMVQQGLTSGTLTPAHLHENINAIEQNTLRASQIIQRIRNFIQPAPETYERVDLATLSVEVADLLAAEARARQVTFTFARDPALASVMGDRIQLSQIVLNLYRNAMQAMATVSRRAIGVDVRNEGEQVVLRITDSGIGFSPHVLARMGTEFFTTKPEGLGVGIMISRSIAEQHGGTLTFANASQDGAVATLALPAVQASPLVGRSAH